MSTNQHSQCHSERSEEPISKTNPDNLKNLKKIPVQTIERLTKAIELRGVDIAPTYPQWRDLAFALADELGEAGRSYYHRLSQFHPRYNPKETNKQFTACLNAKGHGITIKTLYHLAKISNIAISPKWQYGHMDISNNLDISAHHPQAQSAQLPAPGVILSEAHEVCEVEEPVSLPTFPEAIYRQLPDFLKQITFHANSNVDADLLLLGSLVVASACFPNVCGIYGGVTVFPNLFLFVSAQASAGKGRLSLCRRLVEPIHKQLREMNKLETEEYKRLQAEYNADKKNPDAEQPQEPPLRVLFIPANSSATAVFQILNDNAGVGLIFETEGDTMAQTFKSEHGNYSDGFRKAFHHEKISYLRRKDREYITLEIPKLSALLSGTPRQVKTLIPDAENGLFSRFIFYYMNIKLQWIDVFAANSNALDVQFNQLGNQFFDFYIAMKRFDDIRFSLTLEQQTVFNRQFERVQQEYWELLGDDYIGTIRRLGLITFRVAMILSVFRIMDSGAVGKRIVCDDVDFGVAMEISGVLIQHAAHIFRQLTPDHQNNASGCHPERSEGPKMLLYNALPQQFDRPKYIEVASQLNIPESTADKQIARHLTTGLLTKQAHNNYTKSTLPAQRNQ